jgi:hypothetical protein
MQWAELLDRRLLLNGHPQGSLTPPNISELIRAGHIPCIDKRIFCNARVSMPYRNMRNQFLGNLNSWWNCCKPYSFRKWNRNLSIVLQAYRLKLQLIIWRGCVHICEIGLCPFVKTNRRRLYPMLSKHYRLI